ncbi:MAG: CHAT domain-containing protein [Candidatus Omnitrophica bacterium]|nr:CHAT domain-containing protein [Candidatus Omnitrophota bacterium]
MQEKSSNLYLEVSRNNRVFKMGIYQEEQKHTIKLYSQCIVSFEDVERVSRQIELLLQRRLLKEIDSSGLLKELKKNGQVLWDILFPLPIKQQLWKTTAEHLTISLEEELIFIPWEVVFDGAEFLCLRFSIGRVICSQQQPLSLRYRSSGERLRMLILANPTNDLPSSYNEGISIRNQFDKLRNRIIIDFKSTSVEAYYLKKNINEYDLVHFAGHCEYDELDKNNTGWVMADSRFTTCDILALGQTTPMPALVFSNACQSARISCKDVKLGIEQKTYSMAASFLFAGTNYYIGTLQRVDDEVSLEFAKEFYQHLISGQSVGDSLRKARKVLAKRYGLGNLQWAQYVLYGSPDYCFFPKERKTLLKKQLSLSQLIKLYKLPLTLIVFLIFILCVLSFTRFVVVYFKPSSYVLYQKAVYLSKNGENNRALELARKVQQKDKRFLALYPFLAEISYRMGNNQEAAAYYADYILLSSQYNKPWHIAEAYILSGWFYQCTGEYEKAKQLYEKALEKSQKQKDLYHEAIALRKLAVWYMDKEDYTRSLELLTKSVEINRSKQHLRKYRYNLACDYFDLGLLFSNREDMPAAEEYYKKSRALFLELGNKEELSDLYFNLGELYLMEKEYGIALQYYHKGLEIDQKQKNLPKIASDYSMIGQLYLEMDNFEKAEQYLKQAVEQAETINAKMELADACFSLGILYKKRGWVQKAREYLRQAQEILRKVDIPMHRHVQEELLTLN